MEASSTAKNAKLSNLYSQNCTQKNFTHAPFGTSALVSCRNHLAASWYVIWETHVYTLIVFCFLKHKLSWKYHESKTLAYYKAQSNTMHTVEYYISPERVQLLQTLYSINLINRHSQSVHLRVGIHKIESQWWLKPEQTQQTASQNISLIHFPAER